MPELGESLSDRELDVLRGLAAGASNKQIADDLSISPYTVKTHLRNIYTKLGVSNRTEAMNVALQQGFLSVPGSATAGNGDGAADGEASRSVEMPPVNGAPAVEGGLAAPPSVDAALAARTHRWRTLSLALLGLILLAAAILVVVQWRGGRLLASNEAPFEEQAIGDTQWLASRPLPEPRAGQAAAAVGLDLYLIGGETGDGVSGDVGVFDTRQRTWRRAADKPTAVTGATAAELFGEIYVPGGRLDSGEATAVVEAYSPSQNAWRRVAPLPRPIAGGLAVADGAFLYVIGGQDGDTVLDTAYVYDPAADSWRPVADLPEPRAYAAGGALTGQLYAVGGADGAGPQQTCYAYDTAADAWADCPPLLLPRVAAGATVLLNKLYVIGGTAGDDSGYGEVYDPNTQTWTVLSLPPGMTGWAEPGVTHIETRIYALGGRTTAALSDANLVYSPLTYQTYIPAATSGDE